MPPGRGHIRAEPLRADDAARSLAAGTRIPQTSPNTIADGLLTSVGVIRELQDEIVTVREDEFVPAMRLAWERAKLLIEPSSAVAIAAALTPGFRAMPGLERVGMILSGGNVDVERLPWLGGQSSAPRLAQEPRA